MFGHYELDALYKCMLKWQIFKYTVVFPVGNYFKTKQRLYISYISKSEKYWVA